MDKNIEGQNAEKQQLATVMENEDGMSVPNWLVDVLKWITRIEMANSSLSFSCKVFNQLCWPKLHENAKPHFVPWLEFCYGPDKSGNICGILKNLFEKNIPITALSSPEYIKGFRVIYIRFLDTRVIEFIKNINFEEKSLEISMQKWPQNGKQSMLMRYLLTILANNIYKLQISNYLYTNRFLSFNRQFPTFIDQVPYLNVKYISDMDLDILFNWLMKPLTKGRQKILRYRIYFTQNDQFWKMEIRFINLIKEEFLHSTEPKNFLVQLEHRYDQFSLENEQTGEVLNLYHEKDGGIYSFIARYPKREEHWKEESKEKICAKGNTHIRIRLM